MHEEVGSTVRVRNKQRNGRGELNCRSGTVGDSVSGYNTQSTGDNSARHTGAFTTSADSRRDPAIASSYARHDPSCTGSAFTNTESNAPREPGSEEEEDVTSTNLNKSA